MVCLECKRASSEPRARLLGTAIKCHIRSFTEITAPLLLCCHRLARSMLKAIFVVAALCLVVVTHPKNVLHNRRKSHQGQSDPLMLKNRPNHSVYLADI